MQILSAALIALVGVEHIYIAVLEMFLWQKPAGLKGFRMNAAQARDSASLAKNQGLYNLFLAAGLFWSLYTGARDVSAFFLSCVAIAGIFGALTVFRRIFWVQAFPALLALAVLFAS